MENPSRMRSLARSALVYASYWYLLGPAFGVSLQLYVNYRFGLVKVLGSATFPDVICIVSCLVLAAYMTASFFVSLRAQRSAIALVAAVSGVLSVFAMEVPYLFGIPTGVWALVGIVLFSFFLMSHVLLWFEVFVCHDNMLNLIYVLLLSALACALCWFFIGLEGPRLIGVLVLAVILGAAVLLKSFRSTSELNSPQIVGSDRLRLQEWGLLIVTFFFGVGFMYTTSFMSLEDFHNSFDWTIPIYAVVLCAVVLTFSRRVRVSTLYYVAIPITIAGILLTLFDNPTSLSPTILNEVGFFTYLVFILVLFCALGHERNSESSRTSCLLTIGFYLGLFAGRQLFAVVDMFVDADTKVFVHALLAVCILVALVVCTMIGLRIVSGIVSNELSRAQFTHITSFESSEASARIAAIYKLSEREQEVLCLVLENKSATEIADAMVIAHGTAKAHINNIYKKLDIHTREELFAMIPGRSK